MKTCPICGLVEYSGALCHACGYEPLTVSKAHAEKPDDIAGLEVAAQNIIVKQTPHGFMWGMGDGSHESLMEYTEETDAVRAGMYWIAEHRKDLYAGEMTE